MHSIKSRPMSGFRQQSTTLYLYFLDRSMTKKQYGLYYWPTWRMLFKKDASLPIRHPVDIMYNVKFTTLLCVAPTVSDLVKLLSLAYIFEVPSGVRRGLCSTSWCGHAFTLSGHFPYMHRIFRSSLHPDKHQKFNCIAKLFQQEYVL